MDAKKEESSGNYVDSLANMIIPLGKIEFQKDYKRGFETKNVSLKLSNLKFCGKCSLS